MDERGHGIIIRVRPLTDSSLIVCWLTADHGRISTVAKGARRTKSAFAGRLDLFREAEFSFLRSRRSELHVLKEVIVTRVHPRLATNYHSLQVAAYAVSLMELLTETETPLPEAHGLFAGLLGYLGVHPASARAVLAFELKLLASQGLEPDFSNSSLTIPARALVGDLLLADWDGLPGLQASADAARQVRQFLHAFLVFHLGKLPRGRAEALRAGTPPAPAGPGGV